MPAVILREFNGIQVRQSYKEGYISATDLCRAVGKQFNEWHSNDWTKKHLAALVLKTGIPVIKLVRSEVGRYGGTWVHPLVADELARWISPECAVEINVWLRDYVEGRNPAAADLRAAMHQTLGTPEMLNRIDDHELRIRATEATIIDISDRLRVKLDPKDQEKMRQAMVVMGRLCACCGTVEVLDNEAEILLDEDGRKIAQYDHNMKVGKCTIDLFWLICAGSVDTCHYKLTYPIDKPIWLRASVQHRFVAFQEKIAPIYLRLVKQPAFDLIGGKMGKDKR